MTNKELLQHILEKDIECVLWGSEAGLLYGYKTESKKDIDLLIKDSDENIQKIYILLSVFFSHITINQILNVGGLCLHTKDHKYFDIRKSISYPNGWTCDYDTIIENTIKVNFLECTLPMISEKDYIKTLESAITRPIGELSTNKRKKYTDILTRYRQKMS